MTDPVSCIVEVTNNSQWFTPLAILFSAIIGAIIALRSIHDNRDIARKRATLDTILKSQSDEYFERIYSVFSSEIDSTSKSKKLLNAETPNDKKIRLEIENYVNYCELIAISIEQKILDEIFYKEWMKSTYIRHFKKSEPYINQMRDKFDNAQLFIKFEQLAKRWDQEIQS